MKNPFTPTWPEYFKDVPKPKAIIVISAHWYGPGLAVTADQNPKIIHDFPREIVPPELFDIEYPAPGAPWLAERIRDVLGPENNVQLTVGEYGYDHGTWSTLIHIYPKADIPVV